MDLRRSRLDAERRPGRQRRRNGRLYLRQERQHVRHRRRIGAEDLELRRGRRRRRPAGQRQRTTDRSGRQRLFPQHRDRRADRQDRAGLLDVRHRRIRRQQRQDAGLLRSQGRLLRGHRSDDAHGENPAAGRHDQSQHHLRTRRGPQRFGLRGIEERFGLQRQGRPLGRQLGTRPHRNARQQHLQLLPPVRRLREPVLHHGGTDDQHILHLRRRRQGPRLVELYGSHRRGAAPDGRQQLPRRHSSATPTRTACSSANTSAANAHRAGAPTAATSADRAA